MKKLVFTLVAFAALSMSMTSCFDGNKPGTNPDDSTAVVDDSLGNDSLNEDSVASTDAEDADKDTATAETADDEKAPETAEEEAPAEK